MILKTVLLVFALIFMTSCATVSPELFEPCPTHEKQGDTLDEAVRLANVRLESIEQCNDKLEKIKQTLEK